MLFNKTDVIAWHKIMGSGKGSANYDGARCEVNCNIELMDGENMLHHFLSISTNVFVEADPNNTSQGRGRVHQQLKRHA
jgi:hypothetical protein